jgi:hypothetical protein
VEDSKTYQLYVTRNGKMIITVNLDDYTYNPYFGFWVKYLKWFEEAVVMVDQEKYQPLFYQ